MIKRRWYLLILSLSLLTGFVIGQESWALGSPEDWLSIGPVKHVGPYYYPNSDLPTGIQRFLTDYPGYTPIYYHNYYPTYGILPTDLLSILLSLLLSLLSLLRHLPIGNICLKRGGNLW